MTARQSAELVRPVTASERILWLDALRGFALLGIVLANYPGLSGVTGYMSPDQITKVYSEVNQRSVDAFLNFTLDGKFYTLFSLMFGLGFMLQLDRLTRRGAAGIAIFYRRTIALLLIGVCHLLFIYDGDILTLYGLLGLLLPMFCKARDSTLLICGFVLVFATPILGTWFVGDGPGLGAPLVWLGEFTFASLSGIPLDENFYYIDYMAHASWRDYTVMQLASFPFSLGGRLEDWRFAKVLGTMLFGMWAGRRLIEGTLYENRRRLWAILIGALAIGLPANLIYAGYDLHEQSTLASQISTLPMGVSYAAAFVLAWPKLGWAGRALAPVGRMALTNYLLHSTIAIFLFYGIGFGLAGNLTFLQALLLTGGIIAVLVAFSHWWLARYAQGPMETLWRRMTYGMQQASSKSAIAE